MKQKIKSLKGFRDILPVDAAKRNWLRSKMIQVFESWGYEPLETPTLEPLELFAGEIGEDEKLFYKFTDYGGRDVALRYDQTVPTCRFIGQYYNDLTFPFRRYQIQSAYRAEKPQKGRYREFTQSDIDIFGIASPTADAEIITVTLDLYRQLGFKQVIASINNRNLMKDIPYEAIVAIDKLQKIGDDGVIKDMENKGIPIIKAKEYLEIVKGLKSDDTINTIFTYLESMGFNQDWYRFEPTLARSFSYAEGPIWEITIPEYDAGSVGGGERYDSMVKKISGFDIPGTGIGIGFDRTLEAADQLGLIPQTLNPPKVLVTVFDSSTLDKSLQTTKALRDNNIFAIPYSDTNAKLDKQLKYANKKGIPFVIIIGPNEIEKATVTLKNMTTGKQTTDTLDNIINLID